MKNVPLKVTLRNMLPSPTLQEDIAHRAERLEEIFPRLVRCEVLVEAPHRHHRRGRDIAVRVDLQIPGGELVGHASDRNGYAAVRIAFQNARRQLGSRLRGPGRSPVQREARDR